MEVSEYSLPAPEIRYPLLVFRLRFAMCEAESLWQHTENED